MTNFQSPLRVSWSQSGEDISFTSLKHFPLSGNYLDVGANDPIRFSNTNLLYRNGWRGVNIEPNPFLISNLRRHRPLDTNLEIGISKDPSIEMYFFKEDALSTADNKRAAELVNQGRELVKISQVKCRTLRSIYDEFFPFEACDFLNIDAEGLDFEVLESLDLPSLDRNRFPRWILVETQPPVSRSLSDKSTKLLTSFGFEMQLILARASLFYFKLHDSQST